ncbi:MAG TPA: hydrogen gas-evolving membrane-bound hydrogenase subunit E [Candidatus Krumholzibacteriaceae bacterium]
MIDTFLFVLLIFMIVGSAIAIETKNMLSSVISCGIVGAAVSVAFLMLGAPDIAITQVVVEVLILVILIRATITIDNTAIEVHWDTFAVVSSLIFFGLFLVFAFLAVQDLPRFGHPIMKVSQQYLETALQKTGAANVVSSVVLDFRGFDTLGEASVLFVSILGAFVILRRHGRKRRSEEDTEKVGILSEEEIREDYEEFRE